MSCETQSQLDNEDSNLHSKNSGEGPVNRPSGSGTVVPQRFDHDKGRTDGESDRIAEEQGRYFASCASEE